MLDVHPPHAATHTWRDFFIHIATIVIGLLIAVGLEQIVERLHEHYELVETRKSLDEELKLNREAMRKNAANWRWEIVGIENDLLVLEAIQAHPGIQNGDLPGTMVGGNEPFELHTAVWDAAEKSGATRLMPLEEANGYAARYRVMKGAASQDLDGWNALSDAMRYEAIEANPAHLKPAEVDETLRLMEIAWKCKIPTGDSIGLMNATLPELHVDLTWEEVGTHIEKNSTKDGSLHAAHEKTMQRLHAAGMPQNF